MGAWRGEKASESNEPISYRAAVLGLIIGFLLLIGFWVVAGMLLWVAILVFIIHFTILTITTRIRAELGSPAPRPPQDGPDVLIPKMFGMRQLGPRNLSLFALVFPFNRAYRGNTMPPQLEGLKLAERAGISSRRVGFAILIAVVISPLPLFWGGLQLGYESGAVAFGAAVSFDGLRAGLPIQCLWTSWESWQCSSARSSLSLSPPYVIVSFGGPFIPLDTASQAHGRSTFSGLRWLVAWVIKWCVLRFGGLRTFRRLAPFFLGMLFGEFLLGGVWALIGVIVQKPMYRFIW